MKLLLLPGMDGTGILFEPLLSELGGMDVVSVVLPDHIPQDYESLAAYMALNLPDEDFIIVAESFSGGIAAALSQQDIPQLKGIIFVASFLSAPKKRLARLASWLPIGFLAGLPFSGLVYRMFFLGRDAGREEISLFRRAVKAVPDPALKSRLRVIAECRYDGFISSVPAVYIAASDDMLVSPGAVDNFKAAYPSVEVTEIKGPHFILQAQPEAGAAAIIEAVHFLTGKEIS